MNTFLKDDIKDKMHLTEYIPNKFFDCCPVCKSNWLEEKFDLTVEILCPVCYDEKAKTSNSGWYWRRIAYAKVELMHYEDAWINLWYNLCLSFGLVRAIGLSSGKKD